MIKSITTLKKKHDISTEEFRSYYEDHHRLIGEKYLDGFAVRYVRRYLNAVPDIEGKVHPPEYDVLLEIWFPDEAALRACNQGLSEPAVVREIEIDEERLFDRSQKRTYVIEECESVLSE
ncbi:MAG: EthD domain-containing protein [Halioglobus sp.]